LVVHGHFYQPPRDNPWTGRIDRQPAARPFPDWNERIYSECYRPNGFARITDPAGRIERIVNVYGLISFNFGPTLFQWLGAQHPGLVGRLAEADRLSARERGGHGNAIAQAYGHSILPLSTPRDARTQIRWGIADFRKHFRRAPESLWLPETGMNAITLSLLIEEGLKYVILSPFQASRIRERGADGWKSVSDGSIDPRRAYAWFHPDRSGRSIAVFFYDGPIAHAVAFEGILHSSRALVDRFQKVGAGAGQIVNVATDGETYGHHFRYGERCLAHALATEAPQRGFWVTNYGQYLEHFPPTWEVELAFGPGGEGTAWSCAHGLGRWYRDCGCKTGGESHWNQAWRTPLRNALDFLRNEVTSVFEGSGGNSFTDPWEARDAYIELILDRRRSPEDFLRRHSPRDLSRIERERALRLLELERNMLLTYTSCGWFFSDVSGTETVQILGYAARVLDLMEGLDVPVARIREQFLSILAGAKSNLPDLGSAADLFRTSVETGRLTPRRLAAHLAIAGLADAQDSSPEEAGFRIERKSVRRQTHGRITLSTCRLVLQSLATGETVDYATLAMHLGELDFYALIKAFPGEEAFTRSTTRLWGRFYNATLPKMLRLAQEEFGLEEYGLADALPDVRQRIVETLFGSLIQRLCQEYALLYEDNQRTIEMLRVNGFELPPELRMAAELGLGRRFDEEIRKVAGRTDQAAYRGAIAIAQEAAQRGYRLDRSFSNRLFDELVTETVRSAIAEPSDELVRSAIDLFKLSRELLLDPPLERAQEALVEAASEGGFSSDPMRELAATLGLSPILSRPPRKAEDARPDSPTLSRSIPP
jgi:alpha-amylase/alpha-mannosidase (GH57 family)